MHTNYCVVLTIVWLQYSVSCVPSTLFQYFARLTLSGVTRGNWCPQPQMNTHRQFFSSLYRLSSLLAIIDNYNLKSTYFSLKRGRILAQLYCQLRYYSCYQVFALVYRGIIKLFRGKFGVIFETVMK